MPLVHKRRAQTDASPSPPPQRRRRSPSPTSSADGTDNDSDAANAHSSTGTTYDQAVKKLVRLALACEYARQPLRRADINAKVLAPNLTRAYKPVFAAAQTILHKTFGMTMTALPSKEKITVAQKRAAQRATGTSQGHNAGVTVTAYVLTSTLPAALRTPAILAPPKVPSAKAEAAYVGLYTFVIGLIYLSEGGRCSESRLERALGKVNAGEYVLGGEKTEKVLKRMEREGYAVKVREREAGGEESVEYVVGPRGKVEVGETGVAGLLRGVYGDLEGLEIRLERKLGVGVRVANGGRGRRDEDEDDDGAGEAEVAEVEAQDERSARRMPSRSGRVRREAD